MKIANELKECIPKHIRDQMQRQIEDWETEDKMFVSTRASDFVINCLNENSCLTLTAPSGAGKSYIARHTALVLQKAGFKIVPVILPDDIRNFYQPGRQTVFIVDDICGNFTANQQQIDNWKQLLPVIDTIIADKYCKIIVSCRLQVYKDDKFNILLPFKSCECNLISDNLILTSEEKLIIATKYLGSGMIDIGKLSQHSEFFPLLCSLYQRGKHGDVQEFFDTPFIVYKKELDNLSRHGDEGNYKICSLALLVLFNNQLSENWFQVKVTDEERHIIEVICEACEFNFIPKSKFKKVFETLVDTFIYKKNGIYSTVHDKLFDFLAHYFGKKMIECLINHGDINLVHTRFFWHTSPDDNTSNIDFIIEISDAHLESYLKRFIKDWLAGNVVDVFANNNIKVSLFRQKLLENLEQLNLSMQVTLANTNDTVIQRVDGTTGTTPLIASCHYGYTDMVQWMLRNEVVIDQCRDDDVCGLLVASDDGHTDIVKLLLERNPDVNLCNKDGYSPLIRASWNGHTDIVRLLLERNPNVNLCDKDGYSPLIRASLNRHTDIVRLLLERNPDVNLCDEYGSSPLAIACYEGYTDIVRLLLERNPDVSLCARHGESPLLCACQKGHTDIVKLLLEKDPSVNLCDRDGWSPLLYASKRGYTDIVKLLLERNPDPCDNTSPSTSYVNNNTRINNSPRLVQPLLKHKPDINAQTNNGGYALYYSAQNGHIEITQLLLKNNAESNICIHSKQDITETLNNHPCAGALTMEKHKIFDSLVMCTPSSVTEYVRNKSLDYAFDVVAGSSPLHIACFIGRINIVRCLIDHTDDINRTKEDGTTSLFYACEVGHEDIVQLLLEKGANTQLCRIDDKTPLGIATDNGHTSIIMMLTEQIKKESHCPL